MVWGKKKKEKIYVGAHITCGWHMTSQLKLLHDLGC